LAEERNETSIDRAELHAALEARRELGPAYEDEVLNAFLQRIERRIEERGSERERLLKRRQEHQKEMILGAMGIAVPLFIVAAIFTGLAGIIVVCAVLAVIALAVSRST
jgi:hypothetical protein